MRDWDTTQGEGGSSAPETAWLAALVYETLDKVASPAARNALIKAALTSADRERLPDDPEALLLFAVGPLRDAVASVLGSAAGDALVQDLEPILQHAAAATVDPEPTPKPKAAFDAELEADVGLSAEPEPAPQRSLEVVLDLETGFERAVEPEPELGPEPGPEPEIAEPESSPAPPRRRQTLPGAARVRLVEDEGGARVELIGAGGLAGGRVSEVRRHSTFPYVAAVLQQADARHVVVVDDERAFLAGWNGALRQRGFEVFTAPHLDAAVALCRRLRPECVIASAAMPEVETKRIASTIAQANSARSPLAVVLSGDPPPSSIGADELWLMPQDRSPSECVAELAEHLDRRRDEV